MYNIFSHCFNILVVIVLPFDLVMVDGQIQRCASIQVEVETLAGDYQSIDSNSNIIYRPLNIRDLTMRCQCVGGNDTRLQWSYPSDIPSRICTDQSEVCIRNNGTWKQLTIPLVKEIHDGIYYCYVSDYLLKTLQFVVFG